MTHLGRGMVASQCDLAYRLSHSKVDPIICTVLDSQEGRVSVVYVSSVERVPALLCEKLHQQQLLNLFCL